MLVAPLRAIAAALFVASLLVPRPPSPEIAGQDVARARAPEEHVLAVQDEQIGPPLGPPVAWAQGLGSLVVECANTGAQTHIRLYRDDGQIDPWAMQLFVETASELAHTHDINPRTVQLVVKAAYHFKAEKIQIVSGYRRGHGPHAHGDAIDFRLPGVGAGALAAYLRKEPRAGVGVYTNPNTLFVHVDSRDMSFHWIDASPPGKTWKERMIGDPKRDERDAEWTAEMDLPIDG